MSTRTSERVIRVCLCGDVMTGRGIDQILRHAGDPRLHESAVKDARDYYELADRAHGPIPRPVNDDYIWGDAIVEWTRVSPGLRIVNLETAITTCNEYWKGKAVHYRMSPRNVGCLQAARIDCCALANNHILDWGPKGLQETLAALGHAGIRTAGAGRNRRAAERPAVLNVGDKGRVLVFSYGSITGGIPRAWAATDSRPGVSLLPDLSDAAIRKVKAAVDEYHRPGDIVVVSLHWGGNWGYWISDEQRNFARRLIDRAKVDVVHGHSSHHVIGMEVYRHRLILYGCGDFLTDYEGISGYEGYRGDLAVMYFATLGATGGRLVDLSMSPLQMYRFRLRRASQPDVTWLKHTLDRECRRLGTRFSITENDMLQLHWDSRQRAAVQ